MNISRVKKLFAGMSAVAISLTSVGSVFAAYSDVPAGVWYEDAVEAFVDAGYLDSAQTRFRGGDTANRAEFVKLVVELNGGILSTPPAVPSFDDVKPGAWYYGYMEEAGKEGWVKGDGNCYGSHPCYARASANINRAEAAALIVRAFNLEATGDAPSFVDVPDGQWYTDALQTAADSCVVQGDDATGRARPSDNMNRAEMVVMLNRVDQGLTYGVDCSMDGEESEPAIKSVTSTDEVTVEVEFTVEVDETVAADESLYDVSGDADIDVESVTVVDEMTVELTLAEAMNAGDSYTLSVEDMETAEGSAFSDAMDFEGYTEIEKGDGTLEVSVASTSPEGDSVPKGAYGVVMLSLDLTASCDDDVTITELTVLHEGFGDSGEITGVYGSIDGGRVTRKRALDSQDQTTNLRFSTPLTIKACKSVTLDLVADYTATAADIETGAEHNLAVELPSDLQSNALETDGNFPIRGETFKIASVTSGTVTVDYRTVSPDEVDVGKAKVVLGKFEVGASSTEDQTLYAITLENNGTASDGDYTNIRIARTDGTVLTNTIDQSTGDYVTLTFDPPFTVLEGDKITLEVLGDAVAGATETVQLDLEESSDLFAVGSLYGYGKNGQLYGSQVTEGSTAADIVTFSAGQFTVEVDGPVQQKYTADDDDAVLAKVIMTPGAESVDVQSMYVAIIGTTSADAVLSKTIANVLEDVELRNTKTGRTISGVRVTSGTPTPYGDASGVGTFQLYRFDDFIVDKQETWELRVDFITGGPSSGDKFKVSINTVEGTDTTTFGGLMTADADYNLVAEGVTTGDTLTDIRPGSVITGNTHRIASPTLAIAGRAIGTSDTAVKNTKNINLLRFDATAGEAEDILLTSAVFASDSGSLLNVQNYALWVDSDGDRVVDTILEKGVAAGGTSNNSVTFDDLAGGGYVVPADETVTFEVHADVASQLTNSDILLKFATSDYASAEEVDNGSSLTVGTEITIVTATSKNYVLVNQGDLFVKENNKPRSRQLLGGALGDTVLRLEFRSQYEDIDVTKIQIAATGATAASVESLSLYKDAETTAFATATPCSTYTLDVTTTPNTVFCVNLNKSQFTVKRSAPVYVTARPNVKSDENGGASASGVTFFTGSGAIAAQGVQSSNNLLISDGNSDADGEVVINTAGNAAVANGSILGNANDVVLAKITSIVDKAPASTGTLSATADQEIGRFQFTAATNNNTAGAGRNVATLSGVIFTVASTNMDLDGTSFKWYRTVNNQASQKAACTLLTTTSGSLKVQCLDTAEIDTTIDSGESVSFSLEADVDANDVSAAATSSLQVSLANFSDRSVHSFGAAVSNIDWSDGSTVFSWVEHGESTVRSTAWHE